MIEMVKLSYLKGIVSVIQVTFMQRWQLVRFTFTTVPFKALSVQV